MKINTTGSLLSSEDAELRAIKFDRLLRSERVDDEGKQVLLQALPSLELGQLLHLVSSHGDLGAPALIVDRFIALLPSDEMGLWGSPFKVSPCPWLAPRAARWKHAGCRYAWCASARASSVPACGA